MGVAALALLVAVVASVVALRATGEAAEARDLVDALRAAPPSAAPVEPPSPVNETEATTPVEEPTEPTDPNATGEPVITERTTYTEQYAAESLTLTAMGCNSMYADVDEPRSNAEAGYELTFTGGGCSSAPYLTIAEGVDASTDGGRESTPADCLTKIRQSPVGERIPVRKGSVICLTTSYQAAKERGAPWLVARLEIAALPDDSSVTFDAYAWRIE
jgi:hypothetical protein